MKITKADIRLGKLMLKRGETFYCPLEYAFMRLLGVQPSDKFVGVAVGSEQTHININQFIKGSNGWVLDPTDIVLEHPANVVKWLHRYDTDLPVEPITVDPETWKIIEG